ncbi:MAG: formate dehydrogenase subunit gamma [Rhodobacteraceae bacterium]|nr:formate dehydrogenase subunit gamma [Paracoccaceae bacterium]
MTRSLLRILCTLVLVSLGMVSSALAQEEMAAVTVDRSATGGAQTLEDILARQQGLAIDDGFRRDDTGADRSGAAIADQLGTLGGASDPELWRALRYGSANVTVSTGAPAANIIIQDSGMRWLAFRDGDLQTYGGYLLLGMIGVLTLFYLGRGRIRIDGPLTGKTIQRFKAFERFGHWLLGGSFILLGITGLLQLFGRVALIPYFGKEAFAAYAVVGKWIHNNVAWAFMIGLVWVTVTWISHNIPNRLDLKWIAVGGGLFSKGVHPPARKFNAGQKLIFWSVVVLGVSISVSGLSLLFPFKLPLFAATFEHLNAIGLPQLLGLGELPSTLTPHEEMQLAQLWHAIVAFVFIAIVIAHIYIGSIGMQGAFDAMGKGEVDEQWAKEHHGLWYEEVTGKSPNHPAE